MPCSGRKVVYSNSIAATNPNIAKEWHPIKNDGISPSQISLGTNKVYWWKCLKDENHEWKMSPNARGRGQGCPYCSGKRVSKTNSFSYNYPELMDSWNYEMNNLKPEEISYGSDKKVWWTCKIFKEHSWQTTIYNRIQGKGCPFCANQKFSKSNSLTNNYPEIAKQWHPTKNGDLIPDEFIYGSTKKIWWKCDKGEDHIWFTKIVDRTRGKGCPICSGNKTVKSNSIASTHPKLAKQWHPTKNGDLTPFHLSEGSNKKVWWKCDKGSDHEWIANVSSRNNGNGCPFCTLTPQSRQELIITFELKRFFDINPKGFKTKVNNTIKSIDIYQCYT